MKKFVKSISIILASLMLLAAIPFTANANTLVTDNTKYYNEYNDKNLLLHLDTLIRDEATTVNGHEISATIYDADTEKGENPYALYKKANAANVEWNTGNKTLAGVTTDLPINENTQYTIEFYIDNLLDVKSTVGFLWTLDTTTDSTNWTGSLGFSTGVNGNDQLRGVSGNNHFTGALYSGATPTSWESCAETEGENAGYTKFIIELNGKNSTVYLYNSAAGTTFKSTSCKLNYTVNTLGFGFYGYPTTLNGNTESKAIAAIKDVKVYSGLYETTDVAFNCKDGDVLLTVGNLLDTATVNSDYDDVTVTALTAQNCKSGDEAGVMYMDTTTANETWAYAGLNTSLPLKDNSKYTIDFYMSEKGTHEYYTGFLWTTSSWSAAQGFVGHRQNHPKMIPLLPTFSYYNEFGLTTGGHWATMAGSDGYTHFAVEIDGTDCTLYVAGQKVGTYSFAYTANTLGLGMVACKETADYSGEIMAIKNVTVRYGNVMSEVKFVNGSTELSKTNVALNTDLGTILPETPAPEIEGKIVKWFYQGTNTMVLASDKVTADVVIEAREIDPATYTSVAGMQYTTPDANNKQSVRFLARLYTLNATEAGFEVKAVYKDVDGNVNTDKEWTNVSTVVYTSVKATADKTYTAEELNAEYIIALAVDEVPTKLIKDEQAQDIGQIDFYVRSYIKVGGENQYSEWSTFTMNNGADAPELAPLTAAN